MVAPMFVFHLDSQSGVPTYLQLVQQVRGALLLGYLRPGDQLPLIREVVASLVINPNTVSKAYSHLEHEGIVVTRRGVGTFLAESAQGTLAPSAYSSLRRDLERWLRRAHDAGLDNQAVSTLFATTHREFGREEVA
jgi:GntR family transcriptional regulator